MDGRAQASLLQEAVGNQCSQVHFGPWTLLLLAPLPGALFLRAGPREETSLHTEHCASSPGPSLSGLRTTVVNQNVDPCVKMIQNSGWQEQAVQAERGVPVIKQLPKFPRKRRPKDHRHLGKQPCAGGRRCNWKQRGPLTLQGSMEGQPLLGGRAQAPGRNPSPL